MNEAVRRQLHEQPWAHGFFQAVRLLQRLRRDRRPVGYFGAPADEVVRFAVPTSLGFPASEVQTLTWDGSHRAQMGVNVFGLLGQQGVLPYWYSVLIDDASRAQNEAPRAFFDLFQHRMLSLFYRAWEKTHPEVLYERGGPDVLDQGLRSVVGLDAPQLRERLGVRDTTLLFYAGLLGPTQRSAIALQQLLGDYFDVPVQVIEFSGGWFLLDEASRTRLGEDGPSEELGLGAVLGDAIWNEQARVRIRVGPLSRGEFVEFLPGGPAFAELQELVRFHTGDEVDAELQLVLKREDVRGIVLGEDEGVTLGRGSWVRTRPEANDRDDVMFSL